MLQEYGEISDKCSLSQKSQSPRDRAAASHGRLNHHLREQSFRTSADAGSSPRERREGEGAQVWMLRDQAQGRGRDRTVSQPSYPKRKREVPISEYCREEFHH